MTCLSILEGESGNWGGGISPPNSSEMNTGNVAYAHEQFKGSTYTYKSFE